MNNKRNKSTLYIAGVSAIIIFILIIVVLVRWDDQDTNSPNGGTQAAQVNKSVDSTKGSMDAIIDSDISFRDVDFSLTKDDIIKAEKKRNDTLDDPSISASSDGYEYISFESNPDNPLNYNGFTVSDSGTICLTYVLNNGALDEVRLQFGTLDSSSISGLLANLRSSYGDNTFYRSSNGVETYWWKSAKTWLIVTTDSHGTTLFFRKN